MKRSDGKNYKIEEWNGHDIYVDWSGTFFVQGDTFANPRAAEAKSIEALKKALSVGQDVEISGMMAPHWSWDAGKDMTAVTVIKITGLGNLMYRLNAQGPKGPVSKARQSEKIYVADPDRAAERKRLLALQKQTNADLKKLMDTWPVVQAKKP